ncbi:MAG TPA: SagB/ThcOx family dehydrogenase [Candidatus Korarchaeota archaeon]|nr:SagB/ThcOx family dehydrogenase [Candidatus Korarchaeota archaeon]
MKLFKLLVIGAIVILFISALWMKIEVPGPPPEEKPREGEIFLPLPKLEGKVSLEEAIARRRSVREYLDSPLKLDEVSQLLWSAQGITDVKRGFRASPSAGATYPLELYLLVREGGVEGLEAGIYKYDPHRHSIRLVRSGDFSRDLYSAALKQKWVLEAPVNLVITAVYERTTKRYGERGIRYVHMEVGHVGQNVYLQATALNLGSVVVGAFYDEEVKEIIGAPKEVPLYIIPIGRVERLHQLTQEELDQYYTERRG